MSPTSELTSLSLSAAADMVRRRSISPVELAQACLREIELHNPALKAFITVTDELALQQARAAEQEITHGHYRGPLHGIPVALKDLIDTAGVRTTAASAVFQQRVPPEDAEVVRRLKVEGAVLLGKTNLHEFAYGGSGMVGFFGMARNPRSREHIPGGSSSGSASAVATGLCFAALGTDTAGSIRLPAALCGVVGLKPSYGLVSARGVIPLAWSHDHVGPMTRTVEDAALLLHAIAGYDPADIGSRSFPQEDYAAAIGAGTREMHLGIARQYFFEDLEPEVAAAVNNALQVLETLVAGLSDASVPIDTDTTVRTAEIYAYHSSLLPQYADLYQPETLRRIRSHEGITATQYIHKRRELASLRRAAADLFAEHDLLVAPTSPQPAPSIAELQAKPDDLRGREIMLLRNTRPFNVLGLPAISVPCGFTRSGLPVGLQIVGPPGGEARVLRLAHAYEQATEWKNRICNL
ncbi:MAG: amidase [Terriglobales bacterium]